MSTVRRAAALLWLVAASGAVHADSAPAGIKSFGGWTGTCNNIGACVALATADAAGFFYVRIARDAGATAAPRVRLVLLPENPSKTGISAFALKADGAALGPYPAKTVADGSNPYDADLDPGESAAFVEAARNAHRLAFALNDASGTLDLAGLAAALRWIDAQQGRTGTPTALVARGMTPIGQVPEPRPAPVVTAARAGTAEAIDKPTFPKEVLAEAAANADCDRDTIKANETGAAWRLGPDTTLWAVSCIAGAYNFSDAIFLTDAEGGDARPVVLPLPPGVEANNAANIVTNTNFDPKTMVLSEFAKDRGIGDCGDTRDWVWTGREFALLDASQLDACPGALAEDWPSLYTARRADP